MKRFQKVGVSLLAVTLLVSPIVPMSPVVSTAYASTVKAPVVKLVQEDPITAGAVLRKYVWESVRGKDNVRANANVIVVDLQNPHVKLDVMTGQGGKFTTRQSVRGMANENGAVAAINGDFYDMAGPGVPLGAQVTNTELMTSSAVLPGMYAFALTHDRKPIIDTFQFEGKVTAANGIDSYNLSGVNRYVVAHGNGLHAYTSAWGSKARVRDSKVTPTEVWVQNNVVVEISYQQPLDMLPPEGGYILSAAGNAEKFVMEHLQVGSPVSLDYRMIPTDPTKTYDTSRFQTMIGGHTILVENGAPAKFSRDVSSIGGYRSRTALGYSKDGRYVYMITVDHKDDSKGMSLSELQQFMVQIGVWKGLNLDGGGSTQMVSRPLGETEVVLANELEQGIARLVVNGLGVYSTAPQGELKGMFISSEEAMFLNETKLLALKGYDEYYNPLQIDPTQVGWSVSSDLAVFNGAEFTALKPGTVTVKAVSGNGVAQTKEIDIIGRNDIQSMQFEAADFLVAEGNSYVLPVVVVTVKGVKRTIPAELLSWEFIGFSGDVVGNTVTVNKVTDPETARMIARYDGFSTMVTRPVGTDTLFADFDGVAPVVVPQAAPAETTLTALSTARIGNSRTNTLIIGYDFREGEIQTKAAYAAFGEDGKGITIPGKPSKMRLNAHGDGSLNWLRAEFIDANNKAHLVDIAKPVNWRGWKAITVDLEAYEMAYPIKLRRIYVASPKEGQEEREAVGQIAVDDIEFQHKRELALLHKPVVELALGRKSMTLDGVEQPLEVAPYVVNDATLIPVRFFVDAMGGQIQYDATEKRVTVIRDDHLVEMWIGNPNLIIDGVRVESPVAPTVKNNRTMLPLRLISEALGWEVGWNNKTKSITLQ